MTDATYSKPQADHRFGFFTNHALALITIANDPKIRMREIAEKIGITERAVQRIIDDLSTAGYISVVKDGRRNCYEIRRDSRVSDPLRTEMKLGGLLEAVIPRMTPIAAAELG
ncbi:helix-turn-helix transcriptional regulator [Acidicapsa dinghuensis]|uniref:Helix-turn-helix transcriptional regulator n=1 Tax=Acidicapsa dinghuensis TaxID=2218256 RepID=A0ABW1EQ84_9BACT|nr:winged helix-turn-helix domain-containing protein [Acidicapsa dinghuensis]